ncbi:MAG: hypothetical protein IPP77_11845 [Bacteroidetes bacterium]|nr:hypothetical protein [Bacteroidota bacterium]
MISQLKQRKLLIWFLVFVNLTLFGYVYFNYSNSESKKSVINGLPIIQRTKQAEQKSAIDTSTAALKLDYELLNGYTKLFSFEDEEEFFGTNLSIKYPESMISAPGDKKRTIRKFAILDEDRSEFRCVINFQPMKIRSGSLKEKKEALSIKNQRKNIEQLRPLLNNFEILDVVDGIFVANQPACYSEYYFENLKTDGADRINSMSRNYSFFYNGGVGSVHFSLDSRRLSKEGVIAKFESYKRIINRMVNSVEVYK